MLSVNGVVKMLSDIHLFGYVWYRRKIYFFPPKFLLFGWLNFFENILQHPLFPALTLIDLLFVRSVLYIVEKLSLYLFTDYDSSIEIFLLTRMG